MPLILALIIVQSVFASSVDVAVVDITTPVGSVTLEPGQSSQITINATVTGKQDGTATFNVYRDWTLSGGVFTGSNPQTFTVSSREAQDTPTLFSTTGTVTVVTSQGEITKTLVVSAFGITNSNTTGAKLNDGADSNYQVTVDIPTPPPSDTTPPVITPTVSGTLGSNGWYVSDVGVSWSVTDAESDIASTSGCNPTTINYDTAGVTLTCTATSAGGTSSQSVTFKVDKTGPSAALAITAGTLGTNDWYTSDATVSTSGSDTISGPVTCTPDQYQITETDGTIFNGSCTNDAGLSTNATPLTIKLDKTGPTITWNGGPADGGNYYFGFVPAVPTCTAADSLSGPDSCDVTGYGTSIGSHTMTATAFDLAGNSKVETRTFKVSKWDLYGFYQPVDMNGVYNVVKNGSTVPLKFEIFTGSTELTNTTYVKSLNYGQIECSALAPNDAIETIATGGTILRYDLTGGQFIFNWKTPSTAGKCYSVTMTTLDGSSLSAYFKLK